MDENINKVVEMYENGMWIREIAREIGVHSRTVGRWLDKAGIPRRNYFTQFEDEDVCNEYLHGNLYVKDIAKKFNISGRTVAEVLKRNNIDTRDGYLVLPMSNNEIKDLYLSGKTLEEIAELNNCHYDTIITRLRYVGEAPRSNGDSHRKYQLFDKFFFDNIDTPEKAYILGLIYADGHNSIDKSAIIISLQERDRHILESIVKIIYTNNDKPIYHIKRKTKRHQNMCTLAISCKEMCESLLNNFGLTSKKAHTIKFPTLKKELYSHFIRGYFDGDGSITCRKNKNNKQQVSFSIFSSSKQFLLDMRQVLMEDCKLNKTNLSYSKYSHVYGIKYSGGIQIKRIFDYLYKDSGDLKLLRKYQTFVNIPTWNT